MLFDQGIDIPDAWQSEALMIALMPERTRYNLRIKAKNMTAIKTDSGLKLPGKINASTITGDQFIAKLGPDEWFISDDPSQASKLAKSMNKIAAKYIMSATDISHRNVAFKISGAKATDLINVGCPLDLSLEAFQVGKATRTVFENAPIQLFRAGVHEFHMECWRSFAPYLRDFFERVLTTDGSFSP